jgi:NH3-dependent NAD+ synthetase
MTYIITTITDEEKLGKMYENFALSLMLPFDEEITDSQERLRKELRDFNVKQYRQERKQRERLQHDRL